MHGVRDVVISCIDYRFRARVADWIKTELNDQADLIAVAGTSKAFLDDASRAYVLSLLKIARDLHGVTTVHLLDHIDCGAYGGSKQQANEAAERKFHSDKCQEATAIITAEFPELKVQSYIVDFQEVKPAMAK